VLRELMDHRLLDATRQYYRVGETCRRQAVGQVAVMQFDRHGNRTWQQARALLDSEHVRRAVGEVAVPFGVCAEPVHLVEQRLSSATGSGSSALARLPTRRRLGSFPARVAGDKRAEPPIKG
jgi:hypothetical protein